jgi:hypothetical protein
VRGSFSHQQMYPLVSVATIPRHRKGGVSHFQPYQLCVLTELRERGNLLLNAHGTLGFRWEMIKCQINRIEKLLCTPYVCFSTLHTATRVRREGNK